MLRGATSKAYSPRKFILFNIRQRNHYATRILCPFLPLSDTSLHYFLTAAMRQLYHMPVWVVVRLCTDENNVIEYWNNVDSEVELNMDVIDDPLGEAKEIQRYY